MRKSSMWSALLIVLTVIALLISACAATPTDTGGDNAGGEDTGDADATAAALQQELADAQNALGTAQAAGADDQAVADAQATIAALEAAAAAPPPVSDEEANRTGAWLDTIVIVEEPSDSAAFTRLEAGDIDVYAFGVANPEISEQEAASDVVDAEQSFGGTDELTFNPTGPEFADGRLNPFSVPRIREAMNMLVDRTYIVEELYGGLAVERYMPFNTPSSDYALYADIARTLEAKYAYNPEAANQIITEEMEALGATMEDVWMYNGEPVEISVLIRIEDRRRDIGDYVSSQLEDIGFTVIRDYRPASEASPCWLRTDTAEGCFHIYTGGWITTQVPRDLGTNFAYYYTPLGRPDVLWQAYTPSDEFLEVATALWNNDFSTMEERRDLFEQAMTLALEDSARVWLLDRSSIGPRRAEVVVGSDLYGGIYGSQLWAYTIRRQGEVGGSMTIAEPNILTEPWNPIGGTNWIFDQMLVRATTEQGTLPDPFTGLSLPNRIESGSVVATEGLPIRQTLDWVSLEFVDEVQVPEDAWADWDAEAQRFITVGEKFPDGVTSKIMTTAVYPADLYDLTWHDGSTFSVGDVVMFMILNFDQGKEASPYYDASQVPAIEAFLEGFRGVRIVSTDPLTIETYTDIYQLDAENSVTTWFPNYNNGGGAWHNVALGLFVEGAGEAALSSGKAEELQVDWISYIAGPTLELLNNQLTIAAESGAIPYAPTLGEYVGADEIATRYANLQQWYTRRGHFWIGTGPYFLQRAFPVEGNVILERYSDYPDPASRWSQWSTPAIAEVFVSGDEDVIIGDEANFTVDVTFKGQPYASEDLEAVTYLVFDAEGSLVSTGAAEESGEGQFTITLTAEQTGALAEGSNRLEVIVVSKRVAMPTFASLEFVTTP